MKKGSGRKKWLAVLGIGLLCGSGLSVAFLNSSSLIANEARQESATISLRSSQYEAALEEYNQAKEKYEEAKQAYETSKEEYQSLYEDYVTQKEMLDDLKKQADELLPDYQAACSAFEEAKQDYLTRLSFYEESGQKDLQEYQELLAEYQKLETEFFDIKDQYEALQVKIENVNREYQKTEAAYEDIKQELSGLQEEYDELEILYKLAEEKREIVDETYEENLAIYEAAKEAEAAAITAKDQLNEALTALNDCLANFPNTEDIYVDDYETTLAQWQADYEAQKQNVEAAKAAAFEAVAAYQTANDAYLASEIAPADSPLSSSLIDPEDFENRLDTQLAAADQTIKENIDQVQNYLAIKKATDLFESQNKAFTEIVQNTDYSFESFFADSLLILKYSAGQPVNDISKLGLTKDYLENTIATEENLQEIIDKYIEYNGPLFAQSQEELEFVSEAKTAVSIFLEQQQIYAQMVENFNAQTGLSLTFKENNLASVSEPLDQIDGHAKSSYEKNISILESKIGLVDGDLTLGQILRGMRWDSPQDSIWWEESDIRIPNIPSLEVEVQLTDVPLMELLSILPPEITSPSDLSEKPEPPFLAELEEPEPYPTIELPDFQLPEPTPPKITMPMTGGWGVGGFTICGASMMGFAHLFQERKKKKKRGN